MKTTQTGKWIFRQGSIAIMLVALCLSLSVNAQKTSEDKFRKQLSETSDKKEIIEIYLSYARHLSLYENGNFDAKRYADSALVFAEEINSKKGEMLYWNTYGIIARNNNFFHDALEYHNRALSISKAIQETEQRPFIYNNIAYIMRHSGNHAEAIQMLLLGLELAEANDDLNAQSFLLNGLGAGHLMLNNPDKALLYFNKALLNANKLNNSRSKAFNYGGIGEAYFRKKNYTEAESYYNRTLDINQEINDSKGKVIALKGLGDVALEQSQTDKAYKYYALALTEADSLHSKFPKAEIALQMAKTALLLKQFEETKLYINLALEIAEEQQVKEIKSIGYELLAQLYAKQNKHKEAYKALLIHTSLKDSITTHEIEKSVLSAQLKYELERSREQISLLEKQNAAQSERERFKIFVIIISAVSLIVIIVAILLARMVKQKNKINKNLKTALKKNEMLLSEIHHRIKNNFAVVIGLLRLQKKDIDKKPGILAIEDTISRIYTFAAIHEHAYGLKDHSKIDIGIFIKQLAKNIREKSNRPAVEILTVLDPVYPDLSTAVSLALYSNEIISNAFQHGFANKEIGTIKIELTKQDQNVTLRISNTGKELSKDFSIDNADSAGIHIAKLYAGQLKGQFSLNKANNEFVLQFKFGRNTNGPWESKRFK